MTLSPAIASRSRLDARIERRGQRSDQRLDDACGFGNDMLAIVDDQQELLALERRCQGLDGGRRDAQVDSQYVGNDGRDQLRIIERGKLGEPYAIRIVCRRGRGRPRSQAASCRRRPSRSASPGDER